MLQYIAQHIRFSCLWKSDASLPHLNARHPLHHVHVTERIRTPWLAPLCAITVVRALRIDLSSSRCASQSDYSALCRDKGKWGRQERRTQPLTQRIRKTCRQSHRLAQAECRPTGFYADYGHVAGIDHRHEGFSCASSPSIVRLSLQLLVLWHAFKGITFPDCTA